MSDYVKKWVAHIDQISIKTPNPKSSLLVFNRVYGLEVNWRPLTFSLVHLKKSRHLGFGVFIDIWSMVAKY